MTFCQLVRHSSSAQRAALESRRIKSARQLASALRKHGINKNDTVSVVLANTPAMLECHYGVPMAGTVLNTVLATFLVSRYVALNNIHTGDVFVMVVVLVDAWLGPVASFAMALRNVSANLGVGHGPQS